MWCHLMGDITVYKFLQDANKRGKGKWFFNMILVCLIKRDWGLIKTTVRNRDPTTPWGKPALTWSFSNPLPTVFLSEIAIATQTNSNNYNFAGVCRGRELWELSLRFTVSTRPPIFFTYLFHFNFSEVTECSSDSVLPLESIKTQIKYTLFRGNR